MSELIQALQILLKYGDPDYPTHCEHNVMYVYGVDPQSVSKEDKVVLEELGFDVCDECDCFMSYKFGSC